jgi:Histidine kinase-, DNA gyrase B-, and HSP90-like ATPase
VAENNTVNASPTKRFFIAVLVKDINFLDAVVELVDNSVDSARVDCGASSMAGKIIDIRYDKTQFSIRDNAAGISIKQAKNYVFRFGRPKDAPATPGSVGEFGVGMKRALFKIGRHFEVESWTRTEHLRVVVDVGQWESEPEEEPTDWTFPLTAEKNRNKVGTGTHITAKKLYEYSIQQLSGANFGTQLMLNLKQKHSQSLNEGLTITVNGQNIAAEVETLLVSDEIKPIKHSQTIQVDKKKVAVRMVVGVGEAKIAKAGWYIFCNGRQIEQAEKTEKTGWNTALEDDQKTPRIHWQFRRFRGYLFFDSDAPDALPWNTTKTGLDVEALAFRRVKGEMLSAMRQIIDFLNQVDAESDSEGDAQLESALKAASEVALRSLPENRNFVFKASANRPEKKMRISYAVKASIGEVVKESLGVGANREVGEKTFEYYVKSEGLQ